MSGGGTHVSKGRMGCAVIEDVDPAKLESLEKDLNQEMQSLQRCRDSISKHEETIQQQEKDIVHMKHNITKSRTEIKALSERQHTLEKQITQQREQLKSVAPDKKQLAQLESTVADNKKDFDKATAAATKIEDEVHELQTQILEIGGQKLKSAETRLNLVTVQIDKVMGMITKSNVAINTAQRNSKKTEDSVKSTTDDLSENQAKKEELDKEFKQLEVDATKAMESYQQAQEEMKGVETSLQEMKAELSELQEKEQKLQKENIEIKHELEKYETVIKDNHSKVKHWSKELERIVLHPVDGESVESTEKLITLSAEELDALSKEETQYQITVMEERMEQLQPNMAAIEAYRKKEELYLQRVSELDTVTELRDVQRRDRDTLCRARLTDFLAGFSLISLKLKEIYQMITLGGDAELELVDSLDPFSEGIIFSVRPLNKSWKCISNLSGGEKTLSSLALVFALHHFRPTPLYVMDEIDAALDFKNVSIVGHYIKERTANAQFIIISLRQNMFELSDRLIGIYKTYDCTMSTTVDPKSIGQTVATAL